MGNTVLLFLLCTMILCSCYREIEYKTASIEEEKMIAIMADIHLAEGQIMQYTTLTPGQRDSISAEHYQTVFKIHHVNSQDFETTMEAYMSNPEALSKLYEKVLEKLQKDEVIYGKR